VARGRSIRLLNVGGLPVQSDVFPVENLRWSLDEEKRALGRMHVGLVPTDDKPFNRYRFVYKAVIYFCAGIPCLAADQGLNRQMIEHGETGLRYGEQGAPGDFLAQATKLLESGELRQKLARQARRVAENTYDVGVLVKDITSLIDEVASPREPS